MANGINDAGQIIGWSHTSDGESHAVLWENGESAPKDLGTLGGSTSYAYAINETGQIVGGSDITGDLLYHAFLWENEGMLDLGTLEDVEGDSEAFGINDAGQIVGVSDISSDEFHAFLTSRCTPPDASSSGGGGGCFIATAAYGSYWESNVMTLRQFRDSHLLTNKLGKRFVEAYYKYSPPLADYIAEHDDLRAVVRVGLAPLVGFSWLAMNYGMMIAIAVLLSLLTMLISGTCLVVIKKETS